MTSGKPVFAKSHERTSPESRLAYTDEFGVDSGAAHPYQEEASQSYESSVMVGSSPGLTAIRFPPSSPWDLSATASPTSTTRPAASPHLRGALIHPPAAPSASARTPLASDEA
eukprot:CAMPEP_0172152612 /NCGR_PEP_ID=MMETSP1050-20130122/949_1 /TAXON_ID=233186 /ORGANISM="Cryptomonas curvata, Strain CCAP979/52" /LENGTH=112 /DNA_ID=CAMNT_0012820983 /DNA_START=355 /DNA_END=690 /DNA_ORIENTATION=-